MNIQQLIIFGLEILYYTLFFSFCRSKESKIKVFIVFLISNIVSFLIGFGSFYSYMLYFIEIAILCRLLKIKFVLYDLFIIILSMLFKLFIELLFFMMFQKNIILFIPILIMGMSKNTILILLRKKLKNMYIKLKQKWDNNNFYIRYSFTVVLYSYVIASIVYIICNL